ncbi:hypothetical protein JK386_00395 [Nocardioides sp. zg-536]|uniref:AbiEi antitoxin C-terminal domain-containing protein n=1 Tax=Nocardioides faecalis TaxID=2803858 RepID=A0A938XXP2_9ACTN|nr:hypothetical protein [Nocardioides faecalis]MBM9458357.1 hypothetical protein [Nocardioides faecalis]QVI58379.1 hypothetical protein KG111_15475 [Nocardioides faecalis]
MDLQISRPGIVVPCRADPRGLTGPTPGQARGRRWRTTSPGRFVPAGVSAEDTLQRIVEAAAGAPEGSAVTGWAALYWMGARWFPGRSTGGVPLPVEISLGDRAAITARPGVRLCWDWLLSGDVVDVAGLPVTRAARSVTFLVRRCRSLEAAVQVIDMAAADDLVSVAEVLAYLARIAGRPHTRRLRHALELAEENAWSPMEVTLRLRWVQRRRVRPLCNAPIFDHRGRHLLTPDLLDPVAGVVGEYDGAVHEQRAVRRRDLAREEICREVGLQLVSMISTDLRDTRGFERRLDAAYERAAAAQASYPGRERAWTLERPDGWVDTSTVAARRALGEEERQRWLGFRAS